MEITGDSFIKGINGKQIEAFHILFADFYAPLVGYALKLTGDRNTAEDIVQDLFVAVWEKEEKYFSFDSFRVFLYTSVRNTCLNDLKHKKVEEKYQCYVRQHTEETEGCDYRMMEEEIFRLLFDAIEDLPSRCKEIFLMHMKGKKNEEIALELNLSVHTVKTQKKKALQYIRKRMGHLFYYLIYFYILAEV